MCLLLLFDSIFFLMIDIDECALGLHKCSSMAYCINMKGSYHFTCKPRLYGNGRECKDKCFGQEIIIEIIIRSFPIEEIALGLRWCFLMRSLLPFLSINSIPPTEDF